MIQLHSLELWIMILCFFSQLASEQTHNLMASTDGPLQRCDAHSACDYVRCAYLIIVIIISLLQATVGHTPLPLHADSIDFWLLTSSCSLTVLRKSSIELNIIFENRNVAKLHYRYRVPLNKIFFTQNNFLTTCIIIN